MPFFRQKTKPIHATRVSEPVDVNGLHAFAGDWILTVDGEPTQVIPHEKFIAEFDAIDVEGLRMMQNLGPAVPLDHRQQILVGQQFRPAAQGDVAVGVLPPGSQAGAVFDQNLIKPSSQDRHITATDSGAGADRASP